MNISKFGNKIAVPSGIGQLMDDLGAALAQERDVLMLGGGNPARIPEVERRLREGLEAMLRDSSRFERAVADYDPPQGNVEFARAISQLLRDRFGWDISPRNIALTNGSQSAFFVLFNLFAGMYEDGSRRKVLFPLLPEYIGYCDVGLSRDQLVAQRPTIEFLDEHTFKYHIDFDRLAIADDIGAVCVSRPTNPTGNVLTNAELERLSDLARGKDIPLILDNAYGVPFPNIVFTDAEPLWHDNIILSMSLSKLGLPGVRTGIVIARAEIAQMVARANAVMSLAPGSVGPALATDLVRSGQVIDLARQIIQPFYQHKLQDVQRHIRRCFQGLDYRLHQPEGSFFVWLWFPGLPITSQQLYERLKHRRVLVVPGHYFFPGLTEPWSHTQECLRISYAQDAQVVAAGIEIIADEVRRAGETK
jgi:valine--pyruvate aminotransferase